jgi:aspartate racemase
VYHVRRRLNGVAMAGKDKLVGVIGGMGPDATVDFMSRVLRETPAKTDQDHVRMIVDHNPRIPSRQLAMRGEGENPGPVIASMAAELEARGADFLVMPCNLAHAWQSDIRAATSIPFVSIVDESLRSALSRSDDASPIGLMTTPGCFAAGLYQDALRDAGRAAILQTPDELAETMSLVEKIKGGDQSVEIRQGLKNIATRLVDRGAKVLIAACTEFPLVLNESMFKVAFVSSTDVLAKKTVALALGDEHLPNK